LRVWAGGDVNALWWGMPVLGKWLAFDC